VFYRLDKEGSIPVLPKVEKSGVLPYAIKGLPVPLYIAIKAFISKEEGAPKGLLNYKGFYIPKGF
jgi:hypothetical protein